MSDEITNDSQGTQVTQDETWTLSAGRESLQKDPALATLMLRLGAAVNAIRVSQRWSIACKDAPGAAGQRDHVWSFLMAVAYLKEAIDGLLRPHYKQIVELAREDGTPEDAILSLGNLMSRKPHDLYSRLLVNARNRLIFHWEDEPFRQWASKQSNITVAWAQGTGDKEGEVVFVASGNALLDSLIPGASEAEIRSRAGEVAEASGLLVGVFQRAISAYLSAYRGSLENGNAVAAEKFSHEG